MNTVEYAPVAPAIESDLTLDELRMQLDDARSEWASISSKRQNRLFERRIHGYNDAQEQYNQLVIDYGRMELAEALASTDDIAEQRRMTVAYILEQQNELRELTDHTVEGKRSRKFGRSIGKWLTTGSKKVQFAKGATLGLAASMAGGVVGAGIAGLAAVNFAKGYMTSEVHGLGRTDMDEAGLLGDTEDESDVSFGTLLERAQAKSAELFDTDGKEQQVQRRQAAKRGLGVMATGMAFGGIIGLSIDGFTAPSASANPGTDAYVNPGFGDTHANPGVVDSTHTNPGLSEVAAADHTSPGVVEASSDNHSNPNMIGPLAVDTHSNPGMIDLDSRGNPGIDQSADTHTGPGMLDTTDSHTNPGVDGDTDTHTNPGMADTDTHTSPGMATPDSHVGPGMSEAANAGFTVEYGNGYTHELIQAAAANGVDMSVDQAWTAHQAIVDAVGADYIDLTDHSGADTYSMGDTQYETGISAPGEATWSPEALELVNDATDNGVIDGADVPQTDTPAPSEVQPRADTNGPDAEQRQEARIIERSGLEGLQEANQDNADWTEMQNDMQRMESLLQAGDFETVNDTKAFQDTLEYIAHDTEGMTYPGSSTEILAWDTTTERWALNPIPQGSYIPQSVIDVVGTYQQSLQRLAA